MHYFMVEPHCSNFRKITEIFGVSEYLGILYGTQVFVCIVLVLPEITVLIALVFMFNPFMPNDSSCKQSIDPDQMLCL